MCDTITFQLCIFGNQQVGKTSLCRRFVYNQFDEEIDKHHDAEYVHNYRIWERFLSFNQIQMNLLLYDSIVDVESTSVTFWTNANALIAVFDVRNRESFKNCHNLFQFACQFTWFKNCPKTMVGTHCDCYDRNVWKEEAKCYAKEIGCEYHEVSSKTCDGLIEMFQSVVERTIDIFANDYKKKKKFKKKNCHVS
ncbi:Rab family GTPase [Entamoeba marina]